MTLIEVNRRLYTERHETIDINYCCCCCCLLITKTKTKQNKNVIILTTTIFFPKLNDSVFFLSICDIEVLDLICDVLAS